MQQVVIVGNIIPENLDLCRAHIDTIERSDCDDALTLMQAAAFGSIVRYFAIWFTACITDCSDQRRATYCTVQYCMYTGIWHVHRARLHQRRQYLALLPLEAPKVCFGIALSPSLHGFTTKSLSSLSSANAYTILFVFHLCPYAN